MTASLPHPRRVGQVGAPGYGHGLRRADDLGYEVDARLTWKVLPGLAWVFRGGAFFPGDAAGFLLNGTDTYDETAWELRTTVKFTFGGIRIGG